jgi:flavin-dependent dehydrogenase
LNVSYYDIIIVGAGLAGLSCAIHLSKFRINVLLIEKNRLPKHKVCGEYISNEVLPYLEFLDIDPFEHGAKKINQFELSTSQNKTIKSQLPLGGFGISRYTIDKVLADKAEENGVKIIYDSVSDIEYQNNNFFVYTRNKTKYKSEFVIGAYGKRSGLDYKLNRKFIKKKSNFLAVKTHVKGDFPSDLVALHNFDGGYCGASKVEDGSINLCYITDYNSFKKYNNIESFQKNVIYKNRNLESLFECSEKVFKSPLTISQISFFPKNPVEHHVIMCGDTAGLIHPLCGNGMSMAIRSAQIASKLILSYFQSSALTRDGLEEAYRKAWNKAFRLRLKAGQLIANILRSKRLSGFFFIILTWFPFLIPEIIKLTHGKPIQVK